MAVQTQGECSSCGPRPPCRAFPGPVPLSCRSLLGETNLVSLALCKSPFLVSAMPLSRILRLGQTVYLARTDCSLVNPVLDRGFFLAWVYYHVPSFSSRPQLALIGPSLRAQNPYFSWFPLAAPQMPLHLFAPQLFWPRIVDLPSTLPSHL